MIFICHVIANFIFSLSELPECQVALARRTDVIDQILAMALHPAYADCKTAIESVETILNLTQSPETHTYIVRTEVLEKLLETCMLKQIDPLTQKEDTVTVNTLKYVTYYSIVPPLIFSQTLPNFCN